MVRRIESQGLICDHHFKNILCLTRFSAAFDRNVIPIPKAGLKPARLDLRSLCPVGMRFSHPKILMPSGCYWIELRNVAPVETQLD